MTPLAQIAILEIGGVIPSQLARIFGQSIAQWTDYQLITLISAWIVASIALLSIRIIYGALMESSKYQATVGKLAMGIYVTDTNGSRLSFLKAFLRHIGKILSGWILFIGYIMAAFTDKKQALHDYLASSIVVKK